MSSDFHGIVPYLFYDDAEAALDWYTGVFGFKEIGRWTNDEGKIQNAEMRVGDTEIWLDGPAEFPFAEGGYYAFYFLGPDNLKIEVVYMPALDN